MSGTAENPTAGLVPVEIVDKRAGLGLRKQLLGAPDRGPHLTHSVKTPRGVVAVGRQGSRIIARGDQVPVAFVDSPERLGIAHVKHGLSGRVDAREVSIVRSRYGLRRKDRRVLIDGEGIAWRSDYRRGRHFDIVRRGDGSVVLRQDGSTKLLDPAATPAEVSLALALSASGIIQTSSLLNGLTLP